MPQIQQVVDFLNEFAPLALAAEWDNVGLLVGDPQLAAVKIMTCLTVTESTAAEAIAEGVSLIVSHHPLPFRPLKQITTGNSTGGLLWKLIGAGISIHSPHTAFDSASAGINQLWAEKLHLADIQPLEPVIEAPLGTGVGRVGRFINPITLELLAQEVATSFKLPGVQIVGDPKRVVQKAAIACGSGGSMLSIAAKAKCDLFITGEATFHTCLDAESRGMAMLLTGHYASERFGVESLAERLQVQFPDCAVWASRQELDPLRWVKHDSR